MRLTGFCLLASSICVVQAKAIDPDETRIWIKRQFATVNSTNAASCAQGTVTETLRETVTINAANGGAGSNVGSTVTVTVAAAASPSTPSDTPDGVVSAKKFEGLRLSFITETQTIMATAAAQTVTVKESANTVTQMLTVVAEAPPASTVTQLVTQTVPASPVTLTQTLTVAGEAPAAITVTQTVQGNCQGSATSVVPDAPDAISSSTPVVGIPNGIGVGISTVPIPEKDLPTTTFDFDPLAPTSQAASPPPPPPSSVPAGEPLVSSNVVGETTSATASTSVPSSAVNEVPSAIDTITSSLGNIGGTGTSTLVDVPPSAAPTTGPEQSDVVRDTTTLINESSVSTPSPIFETLTSGSSTIAATESTAIETSATEASAVESSAIETSGIQTATDIASSSTAQATDTIQSPDASSSAATPTSAATSLNLGGISPDTTARIESAVVQSPSQTGIAISGGALIFPEINVSTLTFTSALELGNLMGVAAVPTPTAGVQAQATEPVSSMVLNMAG